MKYLALPNTLVPKRTAQVGALVCLALATLLSNLTPEQEGWLHVGSQIAYVYLLLTAGAWWGWIRANMILSKTLHEEVINKEHNNDRH